MTTPYDFATSVDTALQPNCRNCKDSKRNHTEEGFCLFSPTSYVAMTTEEFMTYLSRTVASSLSRRNTSQSYDYNWDTSSTSIPMYTYSYTYKR